MSIEEKRREAFEAAFVAQFGFGRMAASSNPDANAMYRCAEWAWNAALGSVVIELPAKCLEAREFIEGMEREDVVEAIESAGLKVKV